MPRTAKDITDAELSILQMLWDEGPSSVRQLVDLLSQIGPPVQAATVQKLLERLEAKQWVKRDRSESIQKFIALGNRDDLIGQRLEGIAEQLCEGSMTPLLSHLVKRDQLSPEEIQHLRELIDSLDPKSKKKR
jgi:predicted transcriptional regulator